MGRHERRTASGVGPVDDRKRKDSVMTRGLPPVAEELKAKVDAYERRMAELVRPALECMKRLAASQ